MSRCVTPQAGLGPSRLKESFWLIREENKKTIVQASWSEMLDNSLLTRAVRVDSLALKDTKETDRSREDRELSASVCIGEDLQLLISYISIGLAAGVLLPASYWIVLKIYNYSFL